jgi:hypothetical protein
MASLSNVSVCIWTSIDVLLLKLLVLERLTAA